MWDEIREVLENGSEEEKDLFRLTLQAVRQKRERQSAYPSGFMGLSGRFVAPGVYEFRVTVTPYLLNRGGVVHGGMTALLADSTMGSLINRSLPDDQFAVTSEMEIHYLSPGRSKELISRATLLDMRHPFAVASCTITDERERKIAYATGTFFMGTRR
jgi:uncharacterized protein (TIGR00369 family)